RDRRRELDGAEGRLLHQPRRARRMRIRGRAAGEGGGRGADAGRFDAPVRPRPAEPQHPYRADLSADRNRGTRGRRRCPECPAGDYDVTAEREDTMTITGPSPGGVRLTLPTPERNIAVDAYRGFVML